VKVHDIRRTTGVSGVHTAGRAWQPLSRCSGNRRRRGGGAVFSNAGLVPTRAFQAGFTRRSSEQRLQPRFRRRSVAANGGRCLRQCGASSAVARGIRDHRVCSLLLVGSDGHAQFRAGGPKRPGHGGLPATIRSDFGFAVPFATILKLGVAERRRRESKRVGILLQTKMVKRDIQAVGQIRRALVQLGRASRDIAYEQRLELSLWRNPREASI